MDNPQAFSIGFIGTGLMGAPMVRNLLGAGHAVAVWNRTPDKAAALVDHGARLAMSAADAATGASVLITMLPDGRAVETALFEDGAAAALNRGSVVVDMSSIQPEAARAHAERLAGMGLAHIDAPVSGGPEGARAATLAIMAGGREDVFARVSPVLAAMGRPNRVGPSGTGQLAKLANQAIVGVTIGVVAEAIALMRAGGADLDAFRTALAGGFADSKILQIHGARMSNETYAPGARAAIQLKDMENIVGEAAGLGIGLPLSESVRERYRYLVEKMEGGDLDHSALALELARYRKPAD
jgi:2-hydroxy-3-oxopropionate reductase